MEEIKRWLNNILLLGNSVQPALFGWVKETVTVLGKELPLQAEWKKEDAPFLKAVGKTNKGKQMQYAATGKNGLY